MFSIVSVRDVAINLNGEERLFNMFDWPRTHKKGPSTKATSRKESSKFLIENIWILPSHILVLNGESKFELIAFSQYPKMTYLTVDRSTDLLKPVQSEASSLGGVFDVFVEMKNDDVYVFILMRSGCLVVWTFMRSLNEWKYINLFKLCKGKGCQLTSYAFNGVTIMWCEKRNVSHCCICVADIKINNGGELLVENTCAVLHNCLPMLLYPLQCSHFCLMPTSSRPAGLLMFWSHDSGEITVHIWDGGLKKHNLTATSSDFQNIITSSIPLWINQSSTSDRFFVALETHPITKELVVLQQDLQLNVVRFDDSKLKSETMCILEINEEKESFSKRIYKMFLWKRSILLQMLDGELLIFDVKRGLYLWKTDTFKLNSPHVWIRKGKFPTIGVWNKSGIWTFRPKSIRDQVKELNCDSEEEINTPRNSIPDITDIDHAVKCYSEHSKRAAGVQSKRRIKQGVNRKTKMPIHYLFEILKTWKCKRACSELALHLMLKHRQCLSEDDVDEELTELLTCDELTYLISETHDPLLLLSLFSAPELPLACKRHIVDKLETILNSPSASNLDNDIINLINAYVQLQDQIEKCYLSDCDSTTIVSTSTCDFFNTEQKRLWAIDKGDAEAVFLHLIHFDEETVVRDVIPKLLIEEYTHKLWEVIVSRHSSRLLQMLTCLLWNKRPLLLLEFINKSLVVIQKSSFHHILTAQRLVGIVLELIHLPSLGDVTCKQSDVFGVISSRVNIYCKLLLLHDTCCYERCCQLYLQYGMIDHAVDILFEYSKSPNHGSLFSRIFIYLVKNKELSNYVHKILDVIPENFNISELYNVLMSYTNDILNPSVFVQSSSTELSLDTLKPLFELMLKREDKWNKVLVDITVTQ